MSGAAQYGEKPCREGCKNRDMLRIAPQQLFSILQHNRESSGGLKETCAGDHRHNDQHDIHRRLARFVTKDKGKDDKTDAADYGKANAAMPHAHHQAGKQHDKPNKHFHKNSSFPTATKAFSDNDSLF